MLKWHFLVTKEDGNKRRVLKEFFKLNCNSVTNTAKVDSRKTGYVVPAIWTLITLI